MKKLILFLWVGIVLVAGCKDDEDEVAPYHFEGSIINASPGWSLLTVFVEDNYGGYDVDWQGFINNINYNQYWVEAYRVKLTEETVFIDESGEEYTLELESLALDEKTNSNNQEIFEMFHYFYRGIAVKVKEDFEQQLSDDRNNYILYSQEFLPIYTAEKIQFLPLEYDDFLYMIGRSFSDYMVTIVYETGEDGEFYPLYNEHRDELEELSSRIFNDDSAYIYLNAIEKEQFLKYPVPVDGDDYPFYLILDEDDQLIEMTEWDDVVDYFNDARVEENE